MAESFPVKVRDSILSKVLPQDAVVMYAASQQGFVDATKAVHHKADYHVAGDGILSEMQPPSGWAMDGLHL